MTKTGKIIVLAAAALMIAANLFPPYWDYIIDNQGNIMGARTKWKFNRSLLGIMQDISSGSVGFNGQGVRLGFTIYEFPLRRGLLSLEVVGILALTGVALLVTKKR